THTQTHTHTHLHTHTLTHTHTHTHSPGEVKQNMAWRSTGTTCFRLEPSRTTNTSASSCTSKRAYTLAWPYQTHTHKHTRIHTCTHTNTHIHTSIHTYTHTHTNTRLEWDCGHKVNCLLTQSINK